MIPTDVIMAVEKLGADKFISIGAFSTVVGIVWFLLKKVLTKYEEERQKILEAQEQSRELIKETLMQQNLLLANNTKAVETLGESLRILNITFEKVSDKISSHDERSIYITQMLQSQNLSLNSINEKMASDEDIDRLSEKINYLAKTMASKDDISAIHDVLQETENKIDTINMNIAEIKARIS